MQLCQTKIKQYPELHTIVSSFRAKGIGRVSSLYQGMKLLRVKKLEDKSMSLQKSPFLKISSYFITNIKFFHQPKEFGPERAPLQCVYHLQSNKITSESSSFCSYPQV